MSGGGFLQKVADASGLSPIFAMKAIERACRRCTLDPNNLSPAGLRRALPEIERGIRGFHDADSLRLAMTRIRQLCS